MMRTTDQLLEQALRLSPDERVDLAEKLLESVDVNDAFSDPQWSEELRSRINDMRTGKVQGLTWEQTRQIILDDADDDAASA